VTDEREPLDAELHAALAPDAVRARTRARLLARAAADGRTGAPVPMPDAASKVVSLESRRRGVSRSAFVGTLVALAASLLFIVKLEVDQSRARAGFAATDRTRVARIDSLERVVAARDQLVSSLTGAQVQVVGLASNATQNPRALMFWDQATNRWTFVAHHLPALPSGRTYQLWLVTATQKISAGTFEVSTGGDAMVQATYALGRGALKAVAVTQEPVGGVPQPTGAMVLVGSAATE
jgi:hypothetical protein